MDRPITNPTAKGLDRILCWSDDDVIVLCAWLASREPTGSPGEFDIIHNLFAARDQSCRSVFAFNVLHRTESWREIVGEIARTLTPGGTFCFEEMTVRPHQSWLRRLKGESCELQSFDEAMFFAELDHCGLSVETERVVRQSSTGSFQGLAMRR